jgi:hypothetical protein
MNGSRMPRLRRHRDLMELLARARPARLDSDHAAGWPDARTLLAADGSPEQVGEPLLTASQPGRRRRWPDWIRRSSGIGPDEIRRSNGIRSNGIWQPRLWAAVLSATATAAVIVVVVAIVPGAHSPKRGPDSGPVTGQAGPILFHVLQLANGWRSGAPTIATGAPAYGTSGNGIVYLSGSLSRSTPPTGKNGMFAILPKGLRPTHREDVVVTTIGGTTALVQIAPDGQMLISGLKAAQLTSLDGVCFAVYG